MCCEVPGTSVYQKKEYIFWLDHKQNSSSN